MNERATLTIETTPALVGLLTLEAARRETSLTALVEEAVCASLLVDSPDVAHLTVKAASMQIRRDVTAFLADHCELGEAHWERAAVLHRAYATYLGAEISNVAFGQLITHACPTVRNVRKRYEGRLIHAYQGVRLCGHVTSP